MKNLATLLSFTAIIFATSACKQSTENSLPKVDSEVETLELRIDKFSAIPEDMPAECTYWQNERDKENGRYFLAVNRASNTAYMTINRRLTKLSIDAKGKMRSGGYEASVEMTKTEPKEKNKPCEGQLILKAKNGSVLTYSVYGSCGC